MVLKEYQSDAIRNVGIVAHGGAGKTSLTEALLYDTNAVSRLGRVDDGVATTDFEPEEIKRKVTISAALAPCEWKNYKVNFIDTPGYADFAAEVKSSLYAADAALVVLCAAAGVEVETVKVWRYAAELHLPRIAFINKMDRENADFLQVVNTMREEFGRQVVPVQLPIGAQNTFQGLIDLINMKAYIGGSDGKGLLTATDIPGDLLPQAQQARQEMVEAIAEADDELLMKYLDGQELTAAELAAALRKGVAAGSIFPVLCGSAYKNVGVRELLDFVINNTPAPTARTMVGTDPRSQAEVRRTWQDPFAAVVFKTTADPFVGRLNYLRVISGSIKGDSMVFNATKGKMERIGSLYTMRGKSQDPLTAASAGDVVVVAKLQETGTGDTLCDRDHPVVFPFVSFPKPMFSLCVEASNKADEDKISGALHKLMEEDPTLVVKKDPDSGQMLVNGMGELHLDIMVERLKRKFGVAVKLSTPKVPYRETIRGTVKVEGKHKKQTGGHGQYGHVWLKLEPLPEGSGFQFVDEIFGGAVPRQYIPAVEKGLREAMQNGVLAGYPVVDIKATLYDGSYHTVDSSEMAFKIASAMAFKKGALQAKPVLLEPIYNVEVTVPENYTGDVVGDLNSRRGRILGMESTGDGLGVVKAQVPLAELFRYPIDLRSLTQGRGSFDMSFLHYEEVPSRLAETIIANAKKDKAEEA